MADLNFLFEIAMVGAIVAISNSSTAKSNQHKCTYRVNGNAPRLCHTLVGPSEVVLAVIRGVQTTSAHVKSTSFAKRTKTDQWFAHKRRTKMIRSTSGFPLLVWDMKQRLVTVAAGKEGSAQEK
jgi:hypothetical protein